MSQFELLIPYAGREKHAAGGWREAWSVMSMTQSQTARREATQHV
jgi:hypothetical protein